MFSLWQLGVFALLYVMVLFVMAWWGDRAERRGLRVVNNAWTYSLGLGVYCTSWTFYGAVGEASGNGWTYLPIYLGPILTMLLGGELIYGDREIENGDDGNLKRVQFTAKYAF